MCTRNIRHHDHFVRQCHVQCRGQLQRHCHSCNALHCNTMPCMSSQCQAYLSTSTSVSLPGAERPKKWTLGPFTYKVVRRRSSSFVIVRRHFVAVRRRRRRRRRCNRGHVSSCRRSSSFVVVVVAAVVVVVAAHACISTSKTHRKYVLRCSEVSPKCLISRYIAHFPHTIYPGRQGRKGDATAHGFNQLASSFELSDVAASHND